MRALAPWAVLLPLVPACLIPTHVDIDPPDNFPPSIADPLAPPSDYRPIGSHIDLSAIEPGDAGVPTSLAFEVAVRDPDVDQGLLYRVYLNRTMDMSSVGGSRVLPIDPEGDPDRKTRRLTFTIPMPTLDCTRVELYVTSAFEVEGLNPIPVTEGDLAVATWWIVRNREVPISSCREAP